MTFDKIAYTLLWNRKLPLRVLAFAFFQALKENQMYGVVNKLLSTWTVRSTCSS